MPSKFESYGPVGLCIVKPTIRQLGLEIFRIIYTDYVVATVIPIEVMSEWYYMFRQTA